MYSTHVGCLSPNPPHTNTHIRVHEIRRKDDDNDRQNRNYEIYKIHTQRTIEEKI